MTVPSSSWYVYLLYHPTHHRTYIGSTVDPARRLRQHNKEIQGGARSTGRLAPGWTMVCFLSGFENRSVACRWEKILKLRARGFWPRRVLFDLLAAGRCPKGKQYPVPAGLILKE